MTETAEGYTPRPVEPRFTMTEGLCGISAIRDYTRLRRENGAGEDAILAYFYSQLLKALRAAAKENPEEYRRAEALMRTPDMLTDETRRVDGRD